MDPRTEPTTGTNTLFGVVRILLAMAAGGDYGKDPTGPHSLLSLLVTGAMVVWSIWSHFAAGRSHRTAAAQSYTAGLQDGQAHEVARLQGMSYADMAKPPPAGESNVAVFTGSPNPLLKPRL